MIIKAKRLGLLRIQAFRRKKYLLEGLFYNIEDNLIEHHKKKSIGLRHPYGEITLYIQREA